MAKLFPDEDNADSLPQKAIGDDAKQMLGYRDRLLNREVWATAVLGKLSSNQSSNRHSPL